MSRLSDVQIKLETNELQTYLDTFNKEIEEGNQSLNASLVDGADIMSIRSKDDDDEEDTGTYFIDQAGNYYYQSSKDSDPIPTDPPENVQQIVGDSDIDELSTMPQPSSGGKRRKTSHSEVNKSSKISKNEEDDTNYVFILGGGKDEEEGDENDVDNENEDDDNENEVDNDNEDDNEIDDDDADVKEIYEFDENDESFSRRSSFLMSTKVVRLKAKTNVNASPHQCTHCEYVTSKRYLLARHMKCHSEERPHKCSVCERGFKTNASLQNHANTHTGNKPHRCKCCDSHFTTSGELVRHVRYKHTHEKPHKCSECDYASVELSKLKRHIRCHTGERPYQCPHCTYASPDTFKLKRHMRTHTGEKPYECEICHSKFTQSNSLKAHKLIHSVGDKPVFQCQLCPTTCGRKTDLRIHVQKLHTSERPISCKRCLKTFPDRYSYKVHTKTHEGEKCFKCDLCPYASISQRHLDSHLLIHTDQKPFDCKFCEQSFRQKQLLKRHINLYHNTDYVPPTPQEKTHTCPDCKRAFNRKGNLMRHMASHDPESKANMDRIQLKMGRMTRLDNGDEDTVEILSGVEEDEEAEGEYEMGEEEEGTEIHGMIEGEEDDDNEEEIETYIGNASGSVENNNGYPTSLTIKKEEEKELVAVEVIDGHQYMVVEVIQCDDENDMPMDPEKSHDIKNELDDEFIISELTDEGVNIIKSAKGQSAGMDDCFGFSESDDNVDIRDESNRDSKNGIQLLEMLQ